MLHTCKQTFVSFCFVKTVVLHTCKQTFTRKLLSVKTLRINKVALTHLYQWRSSVPVHCVTSPRGGGHHCPYCPDHSADGHKGLGEARKPRCTGDLEQHLTIAKLVDWLYQRKSLVEMNYTDTPGFLGLRSVWRQRHLASLSENNYRQAGPCAALLETYRWDRRIQFHFL